MFTGCCREIAINKSSVVMNFKYRYFICIVLEKQR